MIGFFKLWNGEEIVAKVDSDVFSDGTWMERIEMDRPVRHMMTNNGPMLAEYPCAKITVQLQHVVFSGEAAIDLANAYRGLTGGVVLPSKGIQLPNVNGGR
jgi:hypothetical protein